MFAKTRAMAQKYGTKAAAAGTALMVSGMTHAGGIDDLFDAVDLAGISTKIAALALLIVGIALALKGPSIVKRIIAKV